MVKKIKDEICDVFECGNVFEEVLSGLVSICMLSGLVASVLRAFGQGQLAWFFSDLAYISLLSVGAWIIVLAAIFLVTLVVTKLIGFIMDRCEKSSKNYAL